MDEFLLSIIRKKEYFVASYSFFIRAKNAESAKNCEEHLTRILAEETLAALECGCTKMASDH